MVGRHLHGVPMYYKISPSCTTTLSNFNAEQSECCSMLLINSNQVPAAQKKLSSNKENVALKVHLACCEANKHVDKYLKLPLPNLKT